MMQDILGSLSHSSHHYLYGSAYTLVPAFEPKHSLSSKQAIGMGATNPKFAKSVRKPKKTEHYTLLERWQRKSFNNEKYK